MAAFDHAIDLGYRYLETDVRVTSDGVLVVFHDETLDRMTNSVGRVADLTWSELQRASVRGHPIPRFEELLTAWPEARINVDPKSDGAVIPLVRALQQHHAVERACIGSFSDRRIGACRRLLGPALCTSIGPLALARLRAASLGVAVGDINAACAQLPKGIGRLRLVDQQLVDYAHAHNIELHVWTVNDANTMHDLLDLGVAGLMTDETVLLKQVLAARGDWTVDT